MRVLLIAYEFPPSPSPQSLRWAYLSRELAARGHDVRVLTIHLGGETPGLPDLPPHLVVKRTFAGPVRGLLAHLRDRRRNGGASPAGTPADPPSSGALRPPRSWKQSLSELAQSFAARFVFPDVRGEWMPWAKPALQEMLRVFQPEVVISSHEPATSLELGLIAKRQGYPWIADLGDPVLAPYTPPRWRARARELERTTCQLADHVVVTHSGAARLLRERHGRDHAVSVIAQGFAPPRQDRDDRAADIYDPERVELLYTGSFYHFRRPDDLIAALAAHPTARLNIASVTVPESLLRAAEALPAQVRLLGFLPHRRALELQRGADILVNIANEDSSQVPGKFYEYLGSQRPILHLGRERDAIAELLAYLHRGWTCDGAPASLQSWFDRVTRQKAEGTLGHGMDLGLENVRDYGWPALAERLEAIAGSVAVPR